MAHTLVEIPRPIRVFFAKFPLHSYPPIPSPTKLTVTTPTLWILPPRDPEVDLLSSDVECLKWQAYLALRGLNNITVRWDIAPEGGIDHRLPNLHVPVPGNADGELLAAHTIPGWVDGRVEEASDPLEGYRDEAARDESHAWVSLLEGHVHSALIQAQPKPSLWHLLATPEPITGQSLQSLLNPPAMPLSGIFSVFSPYSTRASASTIELQYREAIASLSERLSTDKWFLGSEAPTALDALAFAYLHSILHSTDSIRIEVTRRVNLVAWERRVRSQVRAAFQRHGKPI
ncbi:hypothetical protein PLICRDRAFT_596937 [Plicaturopsis crispa FD-325 SS-3]|nr:hypothetical protein PLICRDRAFT_596937 [Plicaturopsis crispa FD-325 SS-3]